MKYIIILLILLFSFNVHANKIMTVKKGDIVLFDGHLIDTEGLVKIKLQSSQDLKSCKLEKDYQIKKLKNVEEYKLKKCESNSKIEIKSYKKIISVKDKEIEKLQKIAQRANLTPLWVVLGVVGGAVLTTVVVVIVQNVKISL